MEMTYQQWRVRLIDAGHAVEFGERMGTPLVLASEQEIDAYLAHRRGEGHAP